VVPRAAPTGTPPAAKTNATGPDAPAPTCPSAANPSPIETTAFRCSTTALGPSSGQCGTPNPSRIDLPPPHTQTMRYRTPSPACRPPFDSLVPQELTSVMSFASSSGGALLGSPSLSRRSSQQLEAKVDMVYSLLAMLSGQEHADMGETLLALSTNPESCLAMRQSGCIPLLVQMVQSDREPDARRKAASALHNLVHSQPDEKLRKREVRVFKLLEHARAYTEALRNNKEFELEVTSSASEGERGGGARSD
jgi:hypothetical protein